MCSNALPQNWKLISVENMKTVEIFAALVKFMFKQYMNMFTTSILEKYVFLIDYQSTIQISQLIFFASFPGNNDIYF